MEANKFPKELQIIEQNNIEINNKLTQKNNNNTFEKYYILNKDWYNNYKKSFNKQKNNELFSSIKKLCPEIKTKTILLKNDKKTFSFPSNFVLVNQNVINQISNNFGETDKNEILKLSYNVLIFDGCILIKSNINSKILNVSVLKENNDTKYENEIKYIFVFEHTSWMEEEIKFIQKKSFIKYLQFTNIDEKNSVDFREIVNKEKKIIGIIVYIRNKMLKESNLNMKNQSISSSTNQLIAKIYPIFKSLLSSLNHFELFTKQLKDTAKSNPNYILSQKLSNAFENLSLSKTINNDIESDFNSSIKTGKYETIITDLFTKLDKELSKNNTNKNYFSQINESMARQLFKNSHNNPSLIENFFYFMMQNKIICNRCNLIKYEYEYNYYIRIHLEGNNKIIKMSDKLFETKKKYSICQKCQNDKCVREIKIDELPYILIIIIKGNENEKFNLSDCFKITNKQMPGVIYSLNCFIEKGTKNFFYQKGHNWFKIDINNNSQTNVDNYIYDANPSVLFYKNIISGQRCSVNIINNQNNQINNNNNPVPMNFVGNNNAFINNNWNMNNQNNLNNQMLMNSFNNANNQMNMNMNNQMNNINNSNNMNINFNNKQNQMNINNNFNNMFNQLNLNGSNNQMGMNNPMIMNNQMNINNFNNQMNGMNINTKMVLNSIIQNNINKNNNFPVQQNEEEDTIFVTFTFDFNKKQIYLDVNENKTFENALFLLHDKYNWLEPMKNKKYFFQNKEITNYKMTLKDLGITESSDVIIK